MPYKSEAQARLMRAVEHGWKKPGGGGPSVAVAKEFGAADKAHPSGYASGGLVMSKVDRHNNAEFASGGHGDSTPSSFAKTAKLPSKDRKFLQEPSPYNDEPGDESAEYWPDKPSDQPQDYECGRKDCIHSDHDKSLKPVMPRG